jgi:hypothetical protein
MMQPAAVSPAGSSPSDRRVLAQARLFDDWTDAFWITSSMRGGQVSDRGSGRSCSRTNRASFAPYLFALMIATALVFAWAGLRAI